MAYTPINTELGIQPIAVSSTVQNHPLGYIVRAYDPTLGAGEFIYLQGVASTVVGSLVTYNTTGASALSPNTANLGQPVAVSMSANVASQFGWYQTSGTAVITKTATVVAPTVALFQSATPGSVMATVATGRQILNARSVNAASVLSAAATINAVIDRPFIQGQIT